MRLLEVIPTAETDPAVVAAFSAFGDRILGKEVVVAHDTPNFIANRIGTSNMFAALTLMQQQGLTVEEVDALTGTAVGWPRTGDLSTGGYGRHRHSCACGEQFLRGIVQRWRCAADSHHG